MMALGRRPLTRNSLRKNLIAANQSLWLNQDLDDNAVLMHGRPEINPLALDGEEHLIEMPFISGPGTASPYVCSAQVAERFTPVPDVFVADQYAPRQAIASSTSRKMTANRK